MLLVKKITFYFLRCKHLPDNGVDVTLSWEAEQRTILGLYKKDSVLLHLHWFS